MPRIGIHCLTHSPRLVYTIDFLKQHPLLTKQNIEIQTNNDAEGNDINIAYGADAPIVNPDFSIPAQDLFFNQRIIVPPTALHANEYIYQEKKVWSVEKEKNDNALPLIKKKSSSLICWNPYSFISAGMKKFFANPMLAMKWDGSERLITSW